MMDEKREEELPYNKAIGDILGIVNCLLTIADVEAFKKWTSEFHSRQAGNNHLPGYKLVFNTLFRMLTSELERNISLGLTSDDIFDRATFRGISINKLPNTCEKAVLIRNLQYYFNDVISSNSWDSLDVSLQRLSVEVFRKDVIATIRMNLESWMKNHHFKGTREAELDMAIVACVSTGRMKNQDIDNISKVVLDALKKSGDDDRYLFEDDRQVIRLLVWKTQQEERTDYNTDTLTISFRIHDPNKQMILVEKKII